MSQITPYLRIISGGLNKKADKQGDKPPHSVKPAGGGFPALLTTISCSRLSNQAQADKAIQNVKQASALPGDLHANLNSRRALALLIS